MALIVITISDRTATDIDVGVLAEPPIDTSNPNAVLSGAQLAALAMLRAATGEAPVKEDRGLIELIN